MIPTLAASVAAAQNEHADWRLLDLIRQEVDFQSKVLNLIAAANYISPAVQLAMDPRLQNIHSEGYPRKRYHEGQAGADGIEELAVERAKILFGAEHANVQPYRGTMANLAAAMAVLKPGETLLGLECRAGGHYTTSTELHCIARTFRVVPYSLCPETLTLDYDHIADMVRQERPRAIFCGDTAYPRGWDYARLAEIAEKAGAVLIADVSQIIGLIAGGVLPSPIPHVAIATAATYKTLRGPRGGLILCRREHAAAVDRAVYPACQGGPNIMILAGIAAALEEASTAAFRGYARQILLNADALAVSLTRYGFDLVTGGTDTHACLIDVRSRKVHGHVAARQLAKAQIISNGNQIPFDPSPPMRPSGLRLGTPSITTLGMIETDMATVGAAVAEAFDRLSDDVALAALGVRVSTFRERFQLERLHSAGGELLGVAPSWPLQRLPLPNPVAGRSTLLSAKH
jgi:glycine hydroxymethyltransferase